MAKDLERRTAKAKASPLKNDCCETASKHSNSNYKNEHIQNTAFTMWHGGTCMKNSLNNMTINWKMLLDCSVATRSITHGMVEVLVAAFQNVGHLQQYSMASVKWLKSLETALVAFH